MIHDDKIAKARAPFGFGIVKTVDHRQAVGLLVGQARADKLARPSKAARGAIFDDMAAYRRLFDHVGIVHIVHPGHAARRVALRQIAPQQVILLRRRPRAAGADREIGIALDNPPLRGVGLEFVGQHPHRDAGFAIDAAWAIGNILAAAKTDAAKRLVQFIGMRAAQFGENLPLGLAWQYKGTGPGW